MKKSTIEIAKEIGGSYNPQTNTIDCRGERVYFQDHWFNEKGSFDFKLINTSSNWDNMFDCCPLEYLPKDFTIPSHVKSCNYMFNGCINLTHLPENFILPDGIQYCVNMFYGCFKLTHLPDDFIIPDTVISCKRMFGGCYALTQLPTTFRIPFTADWQDMFTDCGYNERKQYSPRDYIVMEV